MEFEFHVMKQRGRKTVGVMGGMGPDATVDFMAKVIALTDSDLDQNHVHMIVDHDPTIPNRQKAIQSGRDDVTSRLGQMARRLESAGADFLVMVCNTAHVFLGDVRASTNIPFVHIIDESVSEIERLYSSARTVGLMATDGCLETGVYQDAVTASGRSAIAPDTNDVKTLMNLINAIKSGDRSLDVERGMETIANSLMNDGADVLIAGCTEIPIVFKGNGFPLPVVASTDVLAQRTVAIATGIVTIAANNPTGRT